MGLLDYARSANYKRFYGDLKEISKRVHKPAWLMFVDAGICFIKYRSGLQDYLNFKFYEKSAAERRTYVTTGDEYYAYQVLCPLEYAEFFSDKVNFHKNFAKYARREYCSPEDGLEAFEAFCERHPSFVKKPRYGLGGGGVVKVDAADIADKQAFLDEMRENGEFVEELVVQDERWSALSPSTNTLRVMTFANNDESRLVLAVARVGSGATIMDNFHQGGMGVLVDTERGCLVGNGFDKKVSYGEFTDGSYTFEDIPIGVYLVYELNANYLAANLTIKESSVTDGTAEVTTDNDPVIELTNEYDNSETSVAVNKIWADNDDLDGSRPTSLVVTLKADGKEITTKVLNADNHWAAVVDKLPLYNGMHQIDYVWEEENVSGYTMIDKTVAGNATIFTNQHIPELVSKTVRKIWDDNNNELKRRPMSIFATLSNGTTVVLSEANGWTATVDNLPKYGADGKEIEYSWTEQVVLGYTQTRKDINGDVTTFTNYLRPGHPTPPKEVEKEPPIRVEVVINHVGDCFD